MKHSPITELDTAFTAVMNAWRALQEDMRPGFWGRSTEARNMMNRLADDLNSATTEVRRVDGEQDASQC